MYVAGFDARLNRDKLLLTSDPTPYTVGVSNLTGSKVIALSGLFEYDPGQGFDLYRRELALVISQSAPLSNDSNAKLFIRAYQVSSDLRSITSMFDGQDLQLPDAGVGMKFDATTGGMAVGSNINTPLWSLAIAQLQSGVLPQTITTVGTGAAGLTPTYSITFPSTCCGGGTLATDNAFVPHYRHMIFAGGLYC